MTSLASPFDAAATERPLWLTTLADLALLLLGFFVLVMATEARDQTRLAAGLRAGFGAGTTVDATPPASAAAQAMALEMARVTGFATGSAALPDMEGTIEWARQAAVDPRVTITLHGTATGGADSDPVAGVALLAQARALTVGEALVRAGAVRPEQLRIAAHDATPAYRAEVTIQTGFSGQLPAGR